jgi:hypothetical protein
MELFCKRLFLTETNNGSDFATRENCIEGLVEIRSSGSVGYSI